VDLVDGRECGECNVCCVTLHIDSDEFRKLPGVRCPHLAAGVGCSIYPNRPLACRTYHCGWRYLPFLSDNWRPDRSGVLIAFTPKEELPPNYERGVGFIVVARPPSGLARAFYHYVAHLIADRVYVTLAVPGPPGYYPAVTVLNDRLRDAARSGNLARIETVISEALDSAKSHDFRPVSVNENRGSPAS
jgi:hypothetical protein